MIEIYLFIHPLDSHNIDILNHVTDILFAQDKKFKFHLIPMINFQTVNQYISTLPHRQRTLENRNRATNTCYQVALDFETIATFNHQSAIDYFKVVTLALQHHTYDESLRDKILTYLDIDVDHFKRRHQLPQAHHRIQYNQQLMHQLNVTSTPACVVYNFSADDDVALMLANQDIYYLDQILQNDHLAENQYVSYM